MTSEPNQPLHSTRKEPAPIAAPDRNVAPLQAPAVAVQWGNYATAPQVVKIARLVAALTALGGVAFLAAYSASGDDFFFWSGLFFLVMGSWLAVGHTRGQSAAWTGQIWLSMLGLLLLLLLLLLLVGILVFPLGVLVFPLGALIHGYLLAQWFSPGVKVWFARY